MVVRPHARARRLAAVCVLLMVLSGCLDSTEPDTTSRNAAAYRAVILDAVDRSGVALDATDEIPVVFIESFDADGIGLEIQVEIVNSLIDQYDIRFIDDREEAIAGDLEDLPVRANSLLIGLGPIVHDGTIDVRTEIYLSLGAIRAYRYTLEGRDDRWATVGSPEEIEPEGFVPAT